MGWISPTGHSDPNAKWSNEGNAYDGNLGTHATGQFGDLANLTLILAGGASLTTYKIRIYCSDTLGGDATNIIVYTTMPGLSEWRHFEGTIPALTWTEIEFNSLISTKLIYIRRAGGGNWWLHGFEVWSGSDGYQPLAPENYIVDNNNVPTDALSEPMQRKLVVGPNGRVHCVFRKCLYGGSIYHVYYAYSDDYGKTWTVEDPRPAMDEYSQYTPSIAVDSSGNPHIVFQDYPNVGRYMRRSAGGSWSLSNFYAGSVLTRVGTEPFEFYVGDEVKGSISEVTKIVTFNSAVVAGSRILGFLGGGSGLIEDEFIANQTIGRTSSRGRYTGEAGPSTGTSLAITSDDRLVVVSPGPHAKTWRWIQSSPGTMFRHALPIALSHMSSSATLDVTPSNGIRIVFRYGDSYYYGGNRELICTGTYGGGWYPGRNFSIASDADGNVHFVVAQTGLGGTNPSILNIKYYKRIGSSWFGPTHITDIDYKQANPSISIDFQDRIHVMWQGKGWGTYVDIYSILMRTYENGAWGATQIILNNEKNQGEYGPSLLHAWHPNSNRLQEPVYIWSRQGSWKIQFGGDLYIAGPPDSLLCEQTKNPTNVSDPNPEFSAIYRSM